MKLDSAFVSATDFFLDKLGSKLAKLEQNSSRQSMELVGLLNKTNLLIDKINAAGIQSVRKPVEETNITADVIKFIRSPAINDPYPSTLQFNSNKEFAIDPKKIKNQDDDRPRNYLGYAAHMNRRVKLEAEKQLQNVKKSVEIKPVSKYINQESPVKNYRSQTSNQSPGKSYANQRMLNYYKTNQTES